MAFALTLLSTYFNFAFCVIIWPTQYVFSGSQVTANESMLQKVKLKTPQVSRSFNSNNMLAFMQIFCGITSTFDIIPMLFYVIWECENAMENTMKFFNACASMSLFILHCIFMWKMWQERDNFTQILQLSSNVWNEVQQEFKPNRLLVKFTYLHFVYIWLLISVTNHWDIAGAVNNHMFIRATHGWLPSLLDHFINFPGN